MSVRFWPSCLYCVVCLFPASMVFWHNLFCALYIWRGGNEPPDGARPLCYFAYCSLVNSIFTYLHLGKLHSFCASMFAWGVKEREWTDGAVSSRWCGVGGSVYLFCGQMLCVYGITICFMPVVSLNTIQKWLFSWWRYLQCGAWSSVLHQMLYTAVLLVPCWCTSCKGSVTGLWQHHSAVHRCWCLIMK